MLSGGSAPDEAMGKLNVLLITYYWPPAGGAGVQRALKFVKYLPEFGINPIVLTVDPGQASYPVLDASLLNDVPAQVEMIRTRSFEPLRIVSGLFGSSAVPYGGFSNVNNASLSQRIMRWIRGNVFIPDARRGWVPFAYREAVRIIRQRKIQAVFISSPPHSSQLIGLRLKKQFPGLKWIADMRDPWTEIYYYKDLMLGAAAAARDAAYERKVLESADEVLVVSGQIKRDFLQKTDSADESKFHVIPNGFDTDDFQSNQKPDPNWFTVSYVGTMADSYRPEVFFEALSQLKSNYPDRSIRFRFVGNAPVGLRGMIERNCTDIALEWLGHVHHAYAVEMMQTSDLLLLVIPDVAKSEGILTGKLFEYIGSGNAIVGLGPVSGDAAAILNECMAGEMFSRDDRNGIFSFIEKVLLSPSSGEAREKLTPQRLSYSRRQLASGLAALIKTSFQSESSCAE